MSPSVPTLDAELALAARCGPERRIVVGIDEVGRGALAGPVAMGACAIEVTGGRAAALPEGVRDSKQLTARRREALVDPILATVRAGAVGWSSAAEIDEIGIVGALTRAALRALDALDLEIDAILLDGNCDLLSAALAAADRPAPRVELRVAADRDCASVAAASILAKVARDARMVELDALAPVYGWASNKGYGSAAHRDAIDRHGPHEHHRRSWRLGSAPAPVRPRAPAPPRSGAMLPALLEPAPAFSSAGVLWGDQWPRQEQEELR
ncbi:ribonuclease HII [Brachybacterium sp. UNK5269]|uniref:ribonuclease HII n=1 Tax=Brachybacterium sp. UNK5269 TaxID=3408576 RepID=UPI003BB1B27F